MVSYFPTYISIYLSLSLSLYIYIYILYIYIYICMYVSLSQCMYVCRYVSHYIYLFCLFSRIHSITQSETFCKILLLVSVVDFFISSWIVFFNYWLIHIIQTYLNNPTKRSRIDKAGERKGAAVWILYILKLFYNQKFLWVEIIYLSIE